MANSDIYPCHAITPRERQVLRLLAAGESSKEIARSLTIAVKTVDAHIDNLKLKTRTKNRVHLVAHALQANIIE